MEKGLGKMGRIFVYETSDLDSAAFPGCKMVQIVRERVKLRPPVILVFGVLKLLFQRVEMEILS